ncbi:MAG: hypothetical protein ABIP19_11030 [Dermatophilaceae bacterium]
MKRTLDDLRGALREDADDTAYPDADALVAGARRRVVATRRRRLAALGAATAAVLVVAGVASTHSTQQGVLRPAGKGTTGTAISPTSSRTASLAPSQSAVDARVYGIDPAIAALPIAVRVLQPHPASGPLGTTQTSTPEGLWLVSYPGTFDGADLGASPQLADYGELLLMTPNRSRILHAYPFRGLPPQWLLVTPQAVYCGRQGDGGLPDSMVCRVDRSTGELGVAVFSSATDSSFGDPRALAGRPGRWRLDGSHPTADLQHRPRIAADGLLFDPYPNQAGSRPLRLDPVTLE